MGVGTLCATYIRIPDLAKVPALLAEYPGAYTEPEMRFYRVEDRPWTRPPEAGLRELSARLSTDVLWLAFQSVVDAFEYHHWRDGALLRTLVFGCYGGEGTWERAEGRIEPWEPEAIFDRERLSSWCEVVSEGERRECERIWREFDLAPGQTVPSLDARETARKVAEYYRLPGWSLGDDGEST